MKETDRLAEIDAHRLALADELWMLRDSEMAKGSLLWPSMGAASEQIRVMCAELSSLRARLAEAEAEAESQLRMAARWFGEYAAKSDENTRLAGLVVRLTEALRAETQRWPVLTEGQGIKTYDDEKVRRLKVLALLAELQETP